MYVTCPKCGAEIPDDEWSSAGEWFCYCGESGIVEYDDDEDGD